jgi:hypothetical protein
MLADLQLFAVLAVDAEDIAVGVEPPEPGPRMRKVGGILTHQLSDRFAEIEANFMLACSSCASCGRGERVEGRVRCQACEVEQRRARLTPEQREAAKQRGLEVARARRKAGAKAGRFDLWA